MRGNPLINRKTLKGEWASLVVRAEIPPPGTLQYQEMRRAFYAGAAALFGLQMTQMDAGEEPTDEDMEYTTSLSEEIDEFAKLVDAGLA